MSASHRPLRPAPHPSPQTLLCVCAWCGRWRDDTNTWHDPLQRPAPDRPLTHGICPACFADQAAYDTPPS